MPSLVASIVTGSVLYGTETQHSDIDTVKIFLPEPEHLLGLRKPTRQGGDRSSYYLHDFVHLLLKGSPNQWELLFAEADHMEVFDLWDNLVEIRDCFWHRKLTWSLVHFINREMNLIERQRRWAGGDVFPDERKAYRRFRRRPELDQYGWDTKAGYHCVRLVLQANRYEKTGTLQFPFPEEERDLLMSIREGVFTYEQWQSWMAAARFDWNVPDGIEMDPVLDYLTSLYRRVLDVGY